MGPHMLSASPGTSSGVLSASTMTYPSTLSTQTPSSLGLTDSPTLVRQLALSRKGPSSSSPAASPARQQMSDNLSPRPVTKQASKTSLRQSPSLDSLASSVAQLRLEQRAVPKRPSNLSSSQTPTRGSPHASSAALTAKQSGETGSHSAGAIPDTRQSSKQAHRLPRKKVPELDTTKTRPDSWTSATPARRAADRAIATPSREPPVQGLPERLVPARREAGKGAASTPTQDKNARRNQQGSDDRDIAQRSEVVETGVSERLAQEREAQRSRDAEWESFGMWDSQREAARVAEDRTRRDANRAIAYPPSIPRSAIRAAPNGVTSIHIGVRPRLHPDRASDSLQRNQPDPHLPAPLFSPLAARNPLEPDNGEAIDKTGRAAVSTSDLATKAKKEYEEWVKRKAQREGGMEDGEETPGTRDWAPRDRIQARPSTVPTNTGSSSLPVTPEQEVYAAGSGPQENDLNPWAGGYAGPYDPSYCQDWSGDPTATGQIPYWDPAYYWWAVQNWPGQGEGMPGMATSGTGTGRVHFADTPEELKGKSRGLPIGETERESPTYDDGPNSNGYNMMYNPYVQQWGMMPGAHATGMSPFAMGGQHPMNPMMAQGAAAAAAEAAMKPFEPGRMKQGRQGHYGYLEGRELAGPPVGFLPAGVTPQMQQPPHPHSAAVSHHTPSPAPAGTRTPSAYDPAPTVAGSQPRTAWGEQSNAPRARYDGTSTAQQYMKADLDSPYPRIGNGGVASAWTKYSNDKTPLSNGMGEDGRLASNHRRMREGEV